MANASFSVDSRCRRGDICTSDVLPAMSNPQRRGVYLLQDGIPVNFADGSYIIGVMDPMTAHFVEVFKGANALNFGASTLGGAINFVSPTANKKHGANMLVKAEG